MPTPKSENGRGRIVACAVAPPVVKLEPNSAASPPRTSAPWKLSALTTPPDLICGDVPLAGAAVPCTFTTVLACVGSLLARVTLAACRPAAVGVKRRMPSCDATGCTAKGIAGEATVNWELELPMELTHRKIDRKSTRLN